MHSQLNHPAQNAETKLPANALYEQPGGLQQKQSVLAKLAQYSSPLAPVLLKAGKVVAMTPHLHHI